LRAAGRHHLLSWSRRSLGPPGSVSPLLTDPGGFHHPHVYRHDPGGTERGTSMTRHDVPQTAAFSSVSQGVIRDRGSRFGPRGPQEQHRAPMSGVPKQVRRLGLTEWLRHAAPSVGARSWPVDYEVVGTGQMADSFRLSLRYDTDVPGPRRAWWESSRPLTTPVGRPASPCAPPRSEVRLLQQVGVVDGGCPHAALLPRRRPSRPRPSSSSSWRTMRRHGPVTSWRGAASMMRPWPSRNWLPCTRRGGQIRPRAARVAPPQDRREQ